MGRTFSAMCLVAGTCIGGGMLALPVVTGEAGFLPSLITMGACCAFMGITGLLFVEALLWFEEGAHLVTVSRALLGPLGRFITIGLYLFIGYASLIAYTDATGELVINAMGRLSGVALNHWEAGLIVVLVFGLVIALGQRVVGPVNAILFVGLLAAYLLLVADGVREVALAKLSYRNWNQSLFALPLMLTIFSYQAVVPSLVRYLHRDARRLRTAIIGGMVIAFFIYAIWQWLILGVVPVESLTRALVEGSPVTEALRLHALGRIVVLSGEFFAFFAMITSFLGVGMGLFDFFCDGFRLERRWWVRICLGLLVITPTFLMSGQYPRLFIIALETTGGFGDAILNGVIPVLLVWSGRYIRNFRGGLRLLGGIPVLVFVLIFALLVLGVEIFERVNFFMPVEDLR